MGQNTFLEVSSSYFHMHWPSTWSDEFNALSGGAAASVDVQRRHRHLHRRSGADRPALPRRLSPADQHRPHALHRRLPRRQPSAEDRIRELVDADRHRRLQHLRRRAAARTRGRPARATERSRPAARPSEVFLLQHAAHAANEDAQLRRLRAGSRELLRAFTLNLGLRWSYYDGDIPAQSGGGGRVVPACACNVYPGDQSAVQRGTRSRRAPASCASSPKTARTSSKASYSRYYESMYTSRVQQHQPEHINTTGVATYAWNGDLNDDGQRRLPRARHAEEPVRAEGERDRSEPEGSEERRDHVRVPARGGEQLCRSTSTGFSAGSTTTTVDQNCFGLPCNTVASTVYTPNRPSSTPGPDNITRHRRRPTRDLLQRLPAVPRQGHVLPHQLRQQRRRRAARSATRRSSSSISKRMSNRWQMQGSYVWSRLDGDPACSDYTNPNNLLDVRAARAAAPTISRTPSSCSAATRRRAASRSARTSRRSAGCRSTAR